MAKYYTTSEVAKICNVHRNTIIGAIRKGLLQIHRTPGGHARISQEDLDDFCHRRSLPTGDLVSRNNRILLVAGDPAFSRLLTDGLQANGYILEIAETAFDAGFLLSKFKPDIVLLDLGLHGLTGDGICRRIRRTPGAREISVIGFSANAEQEQIDKMADAGVDDFLAKPFEVDHLVERVTRLIGPIITGSSGRATTKLQTFARSTSKRTKAANPGGTKPRTSHDGVLSGPPPEEFPAIQ